MLDQVADERPLIDGLFERALVVVAGANAHRAEVRERRRRHREHARLDEEPLRDQLARRRDHHDVVVSVTESLAVGAIRRCGQAQVHRLRVVLREIAIGARERAVALVDDHQLGPRLGPVAKRVDRRDLHDGAGAAPRIGRHDHADLFGLEAEVEQALVRLGDQLATMGHEQRAVAARDDETDQLRRDRRLAGSGGRDEQDAPDSLAHAPAHALDCVELIGAKAYLARS